MKDELKGLEGKVRLEIFDEKGNIIKDTGFIKNTITNAGLAQIALLAGDASAVPFTYLAVGTSSTPPQATQTALAGEITDSGLERASATVSRVTTTQTNDTLQLVKLFNVSGSKTVEEAGIFNDPTAGTMLGRVLTGTLSLVANYSIQITYQVKIA